MGIDSNAEDLGEHAVRKVLVGLGGLGLRGVRVACG